MRWLHNAAFTIAILACIALGVIAAAGPMLYLLAALRIQHVEVRNALLQAPDFVALVLLMAVTPPAVRLFRRGRFAQAWLTVGALHATAILLHTLGVEVAAWLLSDF